MLKNKFLVFASFCNEGSKSESSASKFFKKDDNVAEIVILNEKNRYSALEKRVHKGNQWGKSAAQL